MILLFVALLAAALGWVWGHSVARTKVVMVPTPIPQDDSTVRHDWDPWLCCVEAFTSRGAEHDPTCQHERRSA